MLVVPSSTAFKSPWWDKCKLEASGIAVEQWVQQAKSQDANEYWTLLVSFRDMVNSNIVTLLESISSSPRLELLDIDNCKQLREIPRFPQSMGMVDARNCIGLDPKTLSTLLNQPFCLAQHKNKGRVTLGLVYLGFKGCRRGKHFINQITVSSSVFLFDWWKP
nr:hypothetical protein CFP56_61768 [Quercus suber]